MKIISLLALFSFCAPLTVVSQIFSQNFDSGGTVSDYKNLSSPTSGQWNAISTSGGGVTVSIVDNTLSFTRSTANIGSFSRTTDFSPIPTGMIYKFRISVSGNSAATTSAAVFQVGSGFGTANSAESNANTYARIAFNFTSTDGTFEVRDITNTTNSSPLSGWQDITWALNNTGAGTTYTAPDNSTESIADDKADVWAGNIKIFDDVAVQTTTQTMTDVKFSFSGGTGTITLDDFQIWGVSDGTLPVELTSFTAIVKDYGVELVWRTAMELNNVGFHVEKKENGIWRTIGFVPGHGTTSAPQRYSFTDLMATGVISYRLKQIDTDGNFEYSETKEITADVPQDFALDQNYPNPFNPLTRIRYRLPRALSVTLKIYDILGKEVETIDDGVQEAGITDKVFDASHLASGIYFYTLRAGGFTAVKKMTVLP